MGQTKRKRRTKHRGNAVGAVEARGRTSKPREGAKGSAARKGSRGPLRPLRPPTWKSAAAKAGVGIVILFIFFRFLSTGTNTGQALTMCAVAFLLYTPLMYWTDKWIYARKMRGQGGGGTTTKARR
jgi:hypothetical protein